MKYLLFLIIPISVFSQNSDIERLVNQLVKDEIPTNFSYFNLVDSSFIIQANFPFFEDEVKFQISQSDIRDLNSSEFFQNRKDTILNWNNFQIENVKIKKEHEFPNFHIDSYILIPLKTEKSKLDSLNQNKKENEIIVPIRKFWSKKRINKEIQKNKYRQFENLPKEDFEYYYFSTPMFNSTKSYALISVKRINGGSYYIYKKQNGVWIKVLEFLRWVY